MTQNEFKKMMNVYGDTFYEKTCPKLQAEILRKILNCKVLDDFEKITAVNQYVGNLITNDIVVQRIREIKNER